MARPSLYNRAAGIEQRLGGGLTALSQISPKEKPNDDPNPCFDPHLAIESQFGSHHHGFLSLPKTS